MNTPVISVAALQKMLAEGKKVTILDVRPVSQREEWKIAGSIHKDAYQALSEGDKHILDDVELPYDIPVVTVCAGGRMSKTAADALLERDIQAFSLEGGMKAWNYAWNEAVMEDQVVKIIQVRRVAKGILSYIIGSGDTAIVVDAALDPDVFISLAANHGWTIRNVMDTHVHADYISRTLELAKVTGANHLFMESAQVNYNFTPLTDGQEISFGKSLLKAVLTPGHTPESISYLIDGKYLLTGDTLFIDGVGRPDLKADKEQAILKARQLYHSLGKIKSLPGETLILPAHTSGAIAFDGNPITASLSLLLENIMLLRLSEDEFVAQTIQRIPPTPPNYEQIAALNKSGHHEGINPADLEAGANRCAVS
ncbi:MBL fold metallo-hydrolase [Chitinophaga cymbidii]|uniref:Hydroxyacylglutathione hydrolase n=1 Tax=Chitinophaga cymbidii TaxID=1096750 RepID=A0A512RPX9_9BACT|nr:MBL fold metallo-hydrolase [Chitinophaga cymbidii]GEP97756.1 hydroxyacylglutathione hydrolase [Chitinophaga cymbidii]